MANQSVASGILTDYNGNPFLPRTVFSQTFKDDTGVSLANYVWPVKNGGTGKDSHTSNSVLVGNGTSNIKNISSASGAFYATAANGEPKFGTLPVAQGGTGITSNPSMLVNLGSTTADTVFEATPRPGVTGKLGIANGGTGATSLSANRMLFVSGTTLTTSSHYVASGKLAVNSTSAPSGVFAVSGQSDFGGDVNLTSGHLYLKGATSPSTSNTTQIIFVDKDDSIEHLAISSNKQTLCINPDSSTSEGQIVFYLDQASSMPQGLNCSTGPITGGSLTIPACLTSGNSSWSGNIASGTVTPYDEDGASISGLKLGCYNSSLTIGVHTMLQSMSSLWLESSAHIGLYSEMGNVQITAAGIDNTYGNISLAAAKNISITSNQLVNIAGTFGVVLSGGNLHLENSGLVLSSNIYGTEADRDALTPVEGQVFFVIE